MSPTVARIAVLVSKPMPGSGASAVRAHRHR
jgi:hypothetical protein